MFQLPLIRPSSFSVTEITRYLRTLLESDSLLQDVWISGEVSNISRPASGHIYFTLKDSGAAIKCVIWRSTTSHIPDMQVGSLIEAHGAVSLYERDGTYQLYVNAVRIRGEGELYQEFLRLKARMEADGWFDEERKRPLPERPKSIGIVTSATGAALQDMLNTLRGRYRLAEVVIAPAAVQGVEAPGEIIQSIHNLNTLVHPDVIILGRGGGSMEDLWAFNNEGVVRAVAESEAPVVTGIGHETDFTLADFAADLRAPTPTGAAVAATPSSEDLHREIETTLQDLHYRVITMVDNLQMDLGQFTARLNRESPIRRIERERQLVDAFSNRMELGLLHSLRLSRSHLVSLAGRLAALNPHAVLQRGYAIVHLENGTLVHSADQLSPDIRTTTRFAHGSAISRVESTRLD